MDKVYKANCLNEAVVQKSDRLKEERRRTFVMKGKVPKDKQRIDSRKRHQCFLSQIHQVIEGSEEAPVIGRVTDPEWG